MTVLRIGDPAPDFKLTSDRGATFQLSAYRGETVALFFYPRDDTEGCTLENREFSALAPQFEGLGVALAGISPDPVPVHCRFRDRHGLQVVLLADPQRVAIGPYGVWGPKRTFGHEHFGVHRTSYLIGADGRIGGVWPVRRIRGHARAVLDAARRAAAMAEVAGGP